MQGNSTDKQHSKIHQKHAISSKKSFFSGEGLDPCHTSPPVGGIGYPSQHLAARPQPRLSDPPLRSPEFQPDVHLLSHLVSKATVSS